MSQGNFVTNELPIECSLCGSKEFLVTKDKLCVSESIWEAIEPTERAVYGFTFDNYDVWPISLCNRCILKTYTTLITKEMNNNKISWIFIGKAILATLVAIVIIILSTVIFTGSYRIISAIIALGCFKFVYGIWRHDVINNIRQYKYNSRQLSQLSDIATIPKEALDDEFKREGKRILNILEKEKSENIHGNYKIPRHREHGELPVWAGTLVKSVPTIRTFRIWGSEEEANSHKPKQGGKYSSLFNLVLWKE